VAQQQSQSALFSSAHQFMRIATKNSKNEIKFCEFVLRARAEEK
jgi:hypothetical protein